MINRILERLEAEKQRLRKLRNDCITLSDKEVCDIEERAYNFCKEIVQEESQNGGWIPCSERLPDEATIYLVTEEVVIISRKQYVVDMRLFGTEYEWLCPLNRKVIAWQPLPEPYQPKGE